jgi:hypothetical protein
VGQQAEEIEPVLEELRRYKAEPAIDFGAKPLKWWLKNASRFPRVAAVAREMLAIPASSANVERLFSRSGLTCTDLRNNLDPELVEMIMWLVGNEEMMT